METTPQQPETTPKDKKRSSIRFPYASLNTVIGLVGEIHAQYGHECTLDQLAAALNQTTNSGAFRTKVSSASLFGAVDSARKRVRLTGLGRRLVDPTHHQAACVEAFLNVPLYRELFERYRGGLLPGDEGLESEMVRLGVTGSQSSRARQAFQRSAEEAGLFAHGRDRLVLPSGANMQVQHEEAEEGGQDEEATAPGPARVPNQPPSRRPANQDPLIQGLFSRLPDDGAEFGPTAQEKWLELARHILEAVYGSGQEGGARIEEDPE